jgi:Spy/CpxP family protein refolding chaperone
MARFKVVFLSTVVLVMSAGVVVGRLSAWWSPVVADVPVNPAPPPPPRPPGPPPFIGWARLASLNLTADQKQQMDAIWADTRTQMHKFDDEHDALRQARIDAVYKLLSADQRTQYDAIEAEFKAKGQALETDRDKAMHDANEKSLALLTDAQRKTWEAMTHGNRERRGSFGPSSRSTTRPSAGPGQNGGGGV